jgi:hypothetical protein
MDREATNIAMLKEKTIPMLAKVLSIPEATPSTWGLTAREASRRHPAAQLLALDRRPRGRPLLS